jgi:CheY-like chemotaxis protein
MADDRERCIAAGMDGYLSKPIDKRMLFAVVEQGSPGSDPAAKPLGPSSLDCAAVMERLGGDVELFDDVIGLFLEDCPPRVAAVKAAIDERDAIGLSRGARSQGRRREPVGRRVVRSRTDARAARRESRLEPAEAAWRRLSVEAANVMETLRHLRRPASFAIPHENDRDERSATNEGPRRPAPVHV